MDSPSDGYVAGSIEPYDVERENGMIAAEGLVEKIRAAARGMAEEVRFDPKEHRYVSVSDGTMLAGVSSIASAMPKPWLAAWGAKEAVKALGYTDYGDLTLAEEILGKIRDMDAKGFVRLLSEAKGAHARKKTKALTDGKDGHAWLESHVMARIAGGALPSVPDGFLKRPLAEFLKWEESEVMAWALSEATVASVEHGFAGTLDAAAVMRDGRPAVVDFKFASHVSEDYYLQTAGYALPFEKYGIGFPRRIIVRLPKTETREEYDVATRRYSVVPNEFEAVEVPTAYQSDRRAFLAARELYRWQNQFRKD